MNTTDRGPLCIDMARAIQQHEQAAPSVGASRETNTPASPQAVPIDKGAPTTFLGGTHPLSGDIDEIMSLTFLDALAQAEDPNWDGCIGEAVARRLAIEYRLIAGRLKAVFEMSRHHECFVPSRECERWILTGNP